MNSAMTGATARARTGGPSQLTLAGTSRPNWKSPNVRWDGLRTRCGLRIRRVVSRAPRRGGLG
jgi:hypothetical protein